MSTARIIFQLYISSVCNLQLYKFILMAQVLITGRLALLLLQLAAGKSAACDNAFKALINEVSCVTAYESSIVCYGSCRTLYDNIIENCDDTVSL